MTKTFSEGTDLQQKLIDGVDKLANNVAATLGPGGRNVILRKKDKRPIVTKDGVTVAKFVDLVDPIEDCGAQILKQAANETNSAAGDGTTTSTVLARAILKNSQRYLTSQSMPAEIKVGMDLAAKEVISRVSQIARPVESFHEIQQVATISANGDEAIGQLIASAAEKAGTNGTILVEEAKSMDTTLDFVEGFRFDSGYFAQAFVTDQRKNSVEYDDAMLFVTDHKIDDVKEILPVLELVSRESRPLVIVAEQVEGQALAALIMNAVRGTMRVAAVKAPRYGAERINIMKDLCLSTGATFVSRTSGQKLKDVRLKDFGFVKKVEILKNATTIMGGEADWEQVEEKVESLKSEIKQTEDLSECRRLQERISRLSSGIAVVRVGGATEVEMIEKKHRIEDALEAVKAAQDAGTVPGGGVALLSCRDFKLALKNEDQRTGAEIVRRSLEAPVRQMAQNTDKSADVIIDKIGRKNKSNCAHGWDFKNHKLVNMYEAGIIDPAKVTMTALKNAVSVASILITTSNAIVEGEK